MDNTRNYWMKFLFEERSDKVVLMIEDANDKEKGIMGFVALYSIRRGDRALFKIFLPETEEIKSTMNSLEIEEACRGAISAMLIKGFKEFNLKVIYTNIATSLENLINLHCSLGFKPLPMAKQMDKENPQRVISLSISYNNWRTIMIKSN